MKLQNICNKGREVYLFLRNDDGTQEIVKDNSFFPYYFEPYEKGTFTAYDGTKVKKVFCSEPKEVNQTASPRAYGSDIQYLKNYIVNKVSSLDKTKLKYIFIDIEVMAKELPTFEKPIYTIPCISMYNSLYDKIQTFYVEDYAGATLVEKERTMLEDFVGVLAEEKPDMLLAWNMGFDYPYLVARYKKLTKKDFAKEISPIGETRWSVKELADKRIYYPCGISILDYLQYFKKVFMREASYALDYIAQKHLDEESCGKFDFSTLNPKVKEKNVNDVARMVKIEKKYKILPYFDEIRRLTKAQWEDLYFNSFIIEMLLLEEAKLKGVVLPNCPNRNIDEGITFEGATRECEQTGAMFDIGKFDLTSAYPNMVINFNLDPLNIRHEPEANTIPINGIYWKQDDKALLPSIVRKILIIKDDLKKQRAKAKYGTDEYRDLAIKYDAIKAVVNSAFGVMGFGGFRLYNNEVASTIAFLVRDLLMYVKTECDKLGYKTVYWDTDSTFITTTKDIKDTLNALVQKWAKDKYGKDSISIEFEYEGYFEKLFILTKCRYYGYLKTDKGVKPEIKGMEVKRSSSSKFESMFQDALINKILSKESKESLLEWIEDWKLMYREQPIENIAFPCKIGNKVYKGEPIFIRACNNSKKFFGNFNVEVGELFYYIYIRSTNPKDNVLAFTLATKDSMPLDLIDFDTMIDRSIENKYLAIFEAMGWTMASMQGALM